MNNRKIRDKSAGSFSPQGDRFGERLKQARTEAGYYSQDQFCRELGISEKTYRRWESGACKPRVEAFLSICRATNKNPYWFIP